MSNTTLMQRAEEQIALWELIESADGELSPVLEKWMEEIEKNLVEKVDSYKGLLDNLDAEGERLKLRAKEFRDAAHSVETVITSIKARMKVVMQTLGKDELLGRDYRFKLSRAKAALLINEDELPGQFKMQITQIIPDRTRITEALDSGVFVPGARYEESFSLRSYLNKKGK